MSWLLLSAGWVLPNNRLGATTSPASLIHTFTNQAFVEVFGHWGDPADGPSLTPEDSLRLEETVKNLKHHPQDYIAEIKVIRKSTNKIFSVVAYAYPMYCANKSLGGYAVTLVVRYVEDYIKEN